MNSIDLTINSNIPWKVQVWTEDTTMGNSHDALMSKPISDFELREHGGAYFQIANTPQILADGQRGSFEIGVDHRILLGDDYHDGDYGLEVVYTIIPQ
jgi:3',5'-cyclic AMP phosphodiesterase CpdA